MSFILQTYFAGGEMRVQIWHKLWNPICHRIRRGEKKTLFYIQCFPDLLLIPRFVVPRQGQSSRLSTTTSELWYSSWQANAISIYRCETKYENKCETQYETVYDEVCENAAPQALVAMNKVINVTLPNVMMTTKLTELINRRSTEPPPPPWLTLMAVLRQLL